jgi:flagellar FliL protein
MSKGGDAPAAPLPGGQAPGKSKKKTFLIIGLVVILAAAGGGAAYWKFGMVAASAEESADDSGGKHAGDAKPKAKAKAKKDAAEHEVPEDPGMVPFEPFLVNLADEGGQSYLRVTLSLLVGSEEEAKALEAKPVTLTRLRSALLEVLATQTAEQVSTAEGKVALKHAITEKVDSLELDIEVHDVLFSDFVVQY